MLVKGIIILTSSKNIKQIGTIHNVVITVDMISFTNFGYFKSLVKYGDKTPIPNTPTTDSKNDTFPIK